MVDTSSSMAILTEESQEAGELACILEKQLIISFLSELQHFMELQRDWRDNHTDIKN